MEIKNLNFSYEKIGFKKTSILKNINIKFETNSINAIIGNGSTTLLNLICNNLDNKDSIINNKTIGLANELPEEYFITNKVFDEVKSYSLINSKKLCTNKKINDSLKMVGLSNFQHRIINSLSYSEKKKLSLACLLVTNPQIIVFDNPDIGLDNKDIKELIKLIRLLKNRYKKTIIITSHNIDFINLISDNLYVIFKKEIFLQGKTIDVFKNKNYSKTKLDLPKTIEFSNYVSKNKKIKLGYRSEVNDLIKDIYRNTNYKEV